MSKIQNTGDLPAKLGQPALRALHGAGYFTLEQLSKLTEQELLQLHGIGKHAIIQIRQAFDDRGLSFAKNKK